MEFATNHLEDDRLFTFDRQFERLALAGQFYSRLIDLEYVRSERYLNRRHRLAPDRRDEIAINEHVDLRPSKQPVPAASDQYHAGQRA
jgi:hypothetical protein